MKALVVDKFPQEYLDALASLGVRIDYRPKLTADELATAVGDAEILIVRSTEVREKCIFGARSLSVIIRAGAGVNNIDMKAANTRGIYVSNCPGKNSVAVAELTMGLLLALDRRIVENVVDLRSGKWNKEEYSRADGVMGKTLGIIGTGRIGQEVIARAKGFGVNLIAWSRSLTPEKAAALGVGYCPTIGDLVSASDIVSVHLALNPETRGIVSRDVIALMKPGTIFLNTSRAEVVDEEALAESVRGGRIRVGADVFADEPEEKSGAFSGKLACLPHVYGTHHIGASTTQAQNAVAQEVLEIVGEYVNQGTVRNWVNRAKRMPVSCHLVVRHYDRPGVLANVLGDLKASQINVQEVENVIFEGGKTACCTLRLDARPGEEVINSICARSDEVIQASLVDV